MSSGDSRPDIEIGFNKKEKIAVLIATMALVFTIIYIILIWSDLPERMPTHFGGNGMPDAWGGKSVIFIGPIFGMLTYVLTIGLSFFPSVFNYPVDVTKKNAEYMYHQGRELLLFLGVEIVVLFMYIEVKTVEVALGQAKGLGIGFLPFFLIILFGTIGIKIYKMYKNK